MDQVVLDDKTYIPSKRAALEFGYTQDYVGQLCRGGAIDARRVSGQWYIFPDSLRDYKAKAETFKPEPPKYQPDPNAEATLQVEGVEYISAALAAKNTDYNQDYVGQLARAGKIPSRQIGNRWYVDKAAILIHKKEKDALLRAVQAESVGLKKQEPRELSSPAHALLIRKADVALMTYAKDEKPLFPEFTQALEEVELKAVAVQAPEVSSRPVGASSRIPIRIKEIKSVDMPVLTLQESHTVDLKKLPKKVVSIPGKPISTSIFMPLGFALVLLVAVGLGVLKRDVIFSTVLGAGTDQSASAALGLPADSIIHRLLTKEIVYTRSN